MILNIFIYVTFSEGNSLPEWSVDELNEQDVVGTFDSSGAFLEKKVRILEKEQSFIITFYGILI